MTQSQSRREALRRQQVAQARAKRTQRIVVIGAVVLAVVVAAVFGTILFSQWRSNGTPAAGGTPPNATAAKDAILVNPGKAKPNAPLVQLYLDYQCPVCKQFEDAFGTVVNDLASKGDIQLQYHTMTFLDNNLRNDSSMKAGIAAACADNVGAYSAYHDAVFANQPAQEGVGYTTQQLRVDFPAEAGITADALAQFQQCFDGKATQAFVQGTNEAAAKAGVNSTPTLKVNGKTIPNNTLPTSDPEQLRQLLLNG